MRDLSTLPKAHLHLHFTGSMRLETLVDLAQSSRTRLPSSFIDGDPLRVPADHRGWFRFQRAYDTARHLVTSEETMRRIVVEAALDDAAEGSRRLEIQVDPTSYAPFVGGITPALEIILDAARQATILSGVEVAVIVAASRIRHPLDARTLARLAVRYAGQEPGTVVGSVCPMTRGPGGQRPGARPSASHSGRAWPLCPTVASCWGPPTCATSSVP